MGVVVLARQQSLDRLALVALVASVSSLGLALRYPAEVASWTHGVAREVTPIVARFGADEIP